MKTDNDRTTTYVFCQEIQLSYNQLLEDPKYHIYLQNNIYLQFLVDKEQPHPEKEGNI